jgi:hypothetical protein
MQDIAYKQKYLKYKAKYLELKKGGGKKLKFSEIKLKFDDIKKLSDKLFFNNIKNEITDISQIKNNLEIVYKYRGKDGKIYHTPLSVIGESTFFGDATYDVEIVSASDHTNFILRVCKDNCTGIAK